jgi:diaminohydroxyphosphoribosylaminopyrimidine deaminase/5-amino-6-(5-phosphoribosylamino)uracil reductase
MDFVILVSPRQIQQWRASTIADACRLAIEVAEAFAGATAPNPPVGCVLLNLRGNVLSCEAHKKAASAHAEAAAIAACQRIRV